MQCGFNFGPLAGRAPVPARALNSRTPQVIIGRHPLVAWPRPAGFAGRHFQAAPATCRGLSLASHRAPATCTPGGGLWRAQTSPAGPATGIVRARTCRGPLGHFALAFAPQRASQCRPATPPAPGCDAGRGPHSFPTAGLGCAKTKPKLGATAPTLHWPRKCMPIQQ